MRSPRIFSDLSPCRLPEPPLPGIQLESFCLCPINVIPGMAGGPSFALQHLYQIAFAQAQAVARPSLPERDLLAVWN